MPIIDLDPAPLDQRIDAPGGFSVTPGEAEVTEATPSLGQTLGAAFRQDNTVGAFLSAEPRIDDREEGFSPWDAIKGTKYEPSFASFAEARSSRAVDAVKRQIDRETEDRKVLDAAPWYQSVPAQIAAGGLDLPSLIPGGAFVRGAKGGLSVARSALNVGAAAGLSSAVQEGALQSIQETRSPAESAANIGASVLLGGLLGAGGARLLSAPEWQKGIAMLDGEMAAPPPPDKAIAVLEAANENRALASVGAAANTATSLQDNAIAGRAASMTAAATAQLNPLLRALHSPSAAYRDIMLQMVENPLYLRKNMESVASDAATETLMKEYNGKLAQALEASNASYLDYVKAGGGSGLTTMIPGSAQRRGLMNRSEFNEAVGRAMRRDDTDANPFVDRAAKAYRSQVFDPMKDRAIEMGLLPKDVSVDTAASYFTRMWNSRAISADEQGFKEMVIERVSQQLEDEFAQSIDAHGRRMARLDQDAKDLQLTPEQRVIEAQTVQARLDDLDTRIDLSEKADQLAELRQQAIAARRGGNSNALAVIKDQTTALTKEGGDDLKQFMAERAGLRSRRRNIEFGVTGLEERFDRVLGQIGDAQEANFREMERLIRKGQKLERDLDRLDTDAYEARVEQLADSYASLARKAEASAARAQQAIDNIKASAERGTDRNRIAAERATTEASLGPAEEAAGKRAIAKQAADRNVEKRAKRDEAVQKRLEVEAQRQAALAERMDKTAERLRIAKDFDHDALMDELRDAIQKATREASARSMARGERIARLNERLADLNPAKAVERANTLGQMRAELERKFIERWEVGRGATDVDTAARRANFHEAARQIADEVFDTLTGRAGGGNRPEFITIKSRGPLKERTFSIPDLFRAANGRGVEDFLEHDVERVARRYTRIMGADIELTRKFGSADMAEQIGKIRDDYRNLREGVTDQKALLVLKDREVSDIADLETMRDALRGTDPGSAADTNYARIVRSVNHFNYLRSMGEVALASLTETVRPAMVHGMLPYMETLGQTITNLKGIKASVMEARLAGNVTESILGTRLATMSEITDPYTSRGPVEAFLENLTNIASKWNGIRMLTDMQKSIASVMTQNRILSGARTYSELGRKEKAYLAYIGIDQSMAGRIAQQFAEHGEVADKVAVANTERWTDDVARRMFRAAVNKDVDSIITTKGVADVPVFANTPTGKAMLQFKSFALASHQRVLLRGLQEDQARFVSGLIAMTTIGMMATWFKAASGNRTEKLQDITKNPGWWLGEGLDKAGIGAVPMELANTFEKGTGFNPIKTPLKSFDEGSAISQKNQNRSLLGSFVGPTGGLIDDATQILGLPKKVIDGEEVTQGQRNAAERLLPFNSYFGLRQILRYLVNPQTD